VPQKVRATVLLLGPDGTGKSSLVRLLQQRAADEGVTVLHLHSRPGQFGRREDRGPVTQPHAETPRSTPVALAKVLVILADHVLARVRWRFHRPADLIVIERGFDDMGVDPRRYRLPSAVGAVAGVLARLLPRSDVAVLLGGDPAAISRRKAELPEPEVRRQLRAWAVRAPRVGRRTLVLDTVALEPEACAERVWGAIAGSDWRRVRPAPRRLDLRTTGRPVPPLGTVYRPQRPRARAAFVVAQLATRAGFGERTTEPFDSVGSLLAELGVPAEAIVAIRSSTARRWVLATGTGPADLVVKVGARDDAALRNEAVFLRAMQGAQGGIAVPALRFAGEWMEHFVVATSVVVAPVRRRSSLDTVRRVCNELVLGAGDRAPIVHGDVAPWNLLPGPGVPVLVDWEAAQWRCAPLWDLAHYVTQCGALLREHSPQQAVDLLTLPDSPGWRHLQDVRVDPREARVMLREYLAGATPREQRAQQFVTEMRRIGGAGTRPRS
jgi:hypothetical protein